MDKSSKETYGIIVWYDFHLKKGRLWLFNDSIEQTVEGISGKLGDWFLCSNNGDKWKYTSIDTKLETKVEDWRVEVFMNLFYWFNKL